MTPAALPPADGPRRPPGLPYCACHDDDPPMPDGRCATCLLPREFASRRPATPSQLECAEHVHASRAEARRCEAHKPPAPSQSEATACRECAGTGDVGLHEYKRCAVCTGTGRAPADGGAKP